MATRTVSGSPTVSAAELRRARTLLLDQCDATPPEDDLLGDAIVNAAHALEAAARALEAHDAVDRRLEVQARTVGLADDLLELRADRDLRLADGENAGARQQQGT